MSQWDNEIYAKIQDGGQPQSIRLLPGYITLRIEGTNVEEEYCLDTFYNSHDNIWD